jgi:hypothetical protein
MALGPERLWGLLTIDLLDDTIASAERTLGRPRYAAISSWEKGTAFVVFAHWNMQPAARIGSLISSTHLISARKVMTLRRMSWPVGWRAC